MANVSSSLDIEDLKLIFESVRNLGKCSDGYDIVDSREYKMDDNTKLIVFEYLSAECMKHIPNRFLN